MINPKELRIGNWVVHDSLDQGERFIRIVELREKDFRAEEDEVFPTPREHWEMEGIPLTPEILEKCGFRKGDYTYHDGSVTKDAFVTHGRRYVISRISIGGGHPEYWGMQYFPYYQSQNSIPGELHFLHQLQNLYFALTGEELNYTP